MEIIEDDDAKNYWRVENLKSGGYKLYLPECYPLREIGSYWEDTTALDYSDLYKDKSNIDQPKEKTFLQFMKEGKKIPFEMTYKGPGFSGYMVDSNYWATVWNLFDTELAKKGGVDEEEISKALGQVGERDNKSIVRWLGYAYRGIDHNKRLPTMMISIGERKSLEDFDKFLKSRGEKESMYDKNRMYFDWDEKPKAGDRFRRWWRRTFW